jgi:hypothetical protein
MGIVKKTKEERKADSDKVYENASKRADTPLGDTPDPTVPVTNLKSALADINARSDAREASKNESQAKLDADRIARSRARKSIAGEGSRLHGLASFSDRTRLKQ